MQCPECGSPMDPEEEFCLKCGAIVHMLRRPEEQKPLKLEPESNLKWFSLVVMAFLVVLFIAANYHPILARLFPTATVQMENIETTELCNTPTVLAELFGTPIDCSTTNGCDKVCTDRRNGICVIYGYTPLLGKIENSHCTCVCGRE